MHFDSKENKAKFAYCAKHKPLRSMYYIKCNATYIIYPKAFFNWSRRLEQITGPIKNFQIYPLWISYGLLNRISSPDKDIFLLLLIQFWKAFAKYQGKLYEINFDALYHKVDKANLDWISIKKLIWAGRMK